VNGIRRPFPVHFPVRVAYTWFVAFAVILITPFLWYGLHQAAVALTASIMADYAEYFEDPAYQGACGFFDAVWQYMPVLISLGALIWAIMRTLKEKRMGGSYYED